MGAGNSGNPSCPGRQSQRLNALWSLLQLRAEALLVSGPVIGQDPSGTESGGCGYGGQGRNRIRGPAIT